MKSHSLFIKGILISLMVAMTMSFVNIPIVPMARAADQEAFDTAITRVEPGKEAPQTDNGSIVAKVADLITFAHSLFLPLINFFSYQIGNFLGSDYVYNGAMGIMLQKIWVISRNLVNIAFVFILLYLALNTIFNPKFGMDELKNKLLMLVLLLVAVNFSWLATKVVLDAANVATNVVFSIPSGISNPPTYGKPTYGTCEINNDPNKPAVGTCYPTTIIAPADSGANSVLYWQDKEGDDNDNCAKVQKAYSGSPDSAYNEDGTINEPTTCVSCPSSSEPGGASETNKRLQRRTSICVENLNLTTYNQNTATIYLTYGMARIQNLVNSTGSTGKISMLAVGSFLSVLIQLGYTVALGFLFIVLVIRMGMLWLFVAFSPFMILVLWFNSGDIKADKQVGKFKFGFHEFANWAFAPVKVGAVFAVSFIMISAGQSLGEVNTTFIDNIASKTGFVFKIMDPQSLYMGIGSLQTLIWLIMSLVVLWMGAFGVLSDMSIIGGISTKIGGWGEYIGKMIATTPYWAPVLPLGEGGKGTSISQTLAPILGVKDEIKSYYEKQMRSGSDETRQLQSKALVNNFSNYGKKAAANELTPADAQKIATAYGFRDVSEMMTKDKDMLISAFRTSKVSGGDENKLYDRLSDLAKPKTTAQLNQQATAEAEAAKRVNPTPTPPAAPPTAPPPATRPPAGPTAR